MTGNNEPTEYEIRGYHVANFNHKCHKFNYYKDEKGFLRYLDRQRKRGHDYMFDAYVTFYDDEHYSDKSGDYTRYKGYKEYHIILQDRLYIHGQLYDTKTIVKMMNKGMMP